MLIISTTLCFCLSHQPLKEISCFSGSFAPVFSSYLVVGKKSDSIGQKMMSLKRAKLEVVGPDWAMEKHGPLIRGI